MTPANLTFRGNRLPEGDAQDATDLAVAEIPLAGSFDVVVVGAGTGGVIAAIAAAQEGLSAAVVEPQSFLGGVATGAGIHSYCMGHKAGIQHELDARNSAWSERIGGKAFGFHPEARKLALHEMAEAAGVRCFFRSFFAGAVMEGNAIRGIVAEGEDGLFRLEANIVIDGTGDGDVAAAAGARFLFGREGDHAPQPYSLAPGEIKDGVTAAFRNFDAGYVDPTHAQDVSRAQREGRGLLYREQYSEAERFHYVSPILGVRESRFIEAEYNVTFADQQTGRRFPDAIGQAFANYDNHALDYENESLDAKRWVTVCGQWVKKMRHEIPYRCMVPKDIENLLVACRAAGMTHDAHHLFRMQRDIMALGEAAGVASAVALRNGTSVRKADVRAVQARLVERGALDANRDETAPAEGADAAMPLAELLKEFGTRGEPNAIEEMVRRGASIHAELRALLRTGHADERLMSAIVLGLQGLRDGVEILKETVAARREDSAGHRFHYPRWVGALDLLELLGHRETGAVPLILGLLGDARLDLHKTVRCVRALSRSATREEALPALQILHAREDIETTHLLKLSQGSANRQSAQEMRFELDLALAEAFAKFDEPDLARELAGTWLADERALVRRYARNVLAAIPAPAFAH